MSGYKLLLVPDDWIEQASSDAAYVMRQGRLGCLGPFDVIADVGEDKKITMSRPLYDEIEVVEPPF